MKPTHINTSPKSVKRKRTPIIATVRMSSVTLFSCASNKTNWRRSNIVLKLALNLVIGEPKITAQSPKAASKVQCAIRCRAHRRRTNLDSVGMELPEESPLFNQLRTVKMHPTHCLLQKCTPQSVKPRIVEMNRPAHTLVPLYLRCSAREADPSTRWAALGGI